MKKLAVFAVVLALLVIGCEEQTAKVINDSDYEVTFTFDHFREIPYTLKPHTSGDYDEYPNYIKSYSATPPRVSKSTIDKVTTFYNTPARTMKIVNELDKAILVSSNNCMDNEPVSVPANSEINTVIYSIEPKFSGTTIDNFPVNFTVSTGVTSVVVHW